MARVDEAKANIQRLEADRKYLAANLKRIEQLVAEPFVTVDELDHVRAQLQAQTEAIQQAQATLSTMEAQVAATSMYSNQYPLSSKLKT